MVRGQKKMEAVRDARLALADSRALEEEAERENPVNPKAQLDREAPRYEGSGATPSMGLSQYRGGGTKKGQMRKTARKAYESESDEEGEAHQMGLHLGKHLLGIHGAGYHAKFLKGMGSCSMSGGADTGAYEGMGTGAGLLGRTQKQPKKMLGRTQKMEGAGRMVGAGTGAGKADGRKARADVVRKVMSERGVSMIEASKIVKAEGLY